MLEERGIEHAAGSEAWLRGTLEEIVSQVRRLLDVTGVSFLVVDGAQSHIHPAASWFASDAVRDAFVPVLDRPYEPARGGVTEAAIEGGAPVLIERIADWPGAERARGAPAGHARARRRRAAVGLVQLVVVPLGARCARGDGRILGVLAIARSLPHPAFDAEELRAAACSPTSPRSRSSAPSCSTARSAGRATRRRSTAPRRRSAARSTSASWRRRSARRARR